MVEQVQEPLHEDKEILPFDLNLELNLENCQTEQNNTRQNSYRKGSAKGSPGLNRSKSWRRTTADSSPRLILSAALSPQRFAVYDLRESSKEQKAREEKEHKRGRLDARHNYLLRTVAEHLQVPQADIEDNILEGFQIELMDQFFLKPSVSLIMFCAPKMEPAEATTTTTTTTATTVSVPAPAAKPAKARVKVYITDGKNEKIETDCTILYFIKTVEKPVTLESSMLMHKWLNFGYMDLTKTETKGAHLVEGVAKVLQMIYIPALTNYMSWGGLPSLQREEMKWEIVSNLEGFCGMLNNASGSLEDNILLKKCDTIDLTAYKSAADYLEVANSAEDLLLVEQCFIGWCKQIEQVLAESDQMRKEADDIGPKAELDHWKKRMAKFNSLLDQIKGQECKAALGIMIAAKSKLIKRWKQLDTQITDSANEAKDNVKFLYTLEKFCDPLYKNDPVTMVDHIAGLLNAVRMIHSISRYYNTSERMTSLFIKITNQMITSCKNYITNNNSCKLWHEDRDVVVEKLRACIKLNKEYQAAFHRTKAKLEQSPEERQFEFSEMYIFGKFDTFSKRLEKIMHMFELIESYSKLGESKIEGIERYSTRFMVIINVIKKKSYDLLDHRKMDFDTDYDDFCNQVGDVESEIQRFMEESLDKPSTTQAALQLVKKYQSLKISSLDPQQKFGKILQGFGKDIENVQKLYQKQKNDPPCGRMLPPISGKIAWARQLFRKIEQPMLPMFQVFQQYPGVLESDEARKIIRSYNKVAKVLLEYEVIYHQAWLKQIDVIKSGLNSSLLVRHPDTGVLYVNFDPSILELVREVDCMERMGQEIPQTALLIKTKKATIKASYSLLSTMLNEWKRITGLIPATFLPLMQPHITYVEDYIRPGLTMLTWSSINLDSYVNQITREMRKLELLIKRINDLCTYRIDAVLKDMGQTLLCELPDQTAWTVEQFLSRTESVCNTAAVQLELKSKQVEKATNELIDMMMSYPDEETRPSSSRTPTPPTTAKSGKPNRYSARGVRGLPESEEDQRPGARSRLRKRLLRENLEEEAKELRSAFQHRNLEAILRATRSTLEILKKRVQVSSLHMYEVTPAQGSRKSEVPLFKADIVLSIPAIVMLPGLDEIQQGLNTSIRLILNVSKCILQWGQGELEPPDPAPSNPPAETKSPRLTVATAPPLKPDSVRTYFKSISENKDISKMASLLSTAINATKSEISKALEQFKPYHALWDTDQEKVEQEFLAQDPSLGEFETMILQYETEIDEIADIPESIPVGAIALESALLKEALIAEAKGWKLLYGSLANRKYRDRMKEIFELVEELSKKLSRPISDLDDVRDSMAALAKIRSKEIEIDMVIGPIEDSYAMLNKYELPLLKEEAERVDTLRYAWEKVLSQGGDVQSHLVDIQPTFKKTLLVNVCTFKTEVENFAKDYDLNGPMVTGLAPEEASVRLTIFQSTFDDLWRKYDTYSSGEGLFGLPVKEYPILGKMKKELNLLQKLYTLYNTVIDTVNGYYDILWLDIDIEKINEELNDFQNRCRKLPRALKDWPAYNALKQKIDDFNETCPLLELMTNKALKARHWERISVLTGHTFDFESDTFMLRNIMEAPLLQFKEDIEDICISAVKEKDIEAKLKQVISEWNHEELTFSQFKNRGELLLKGQQVSDIVSKMEDSLMMLGSLMSNRYNAPFKKSIHKWVTQLSSSTDIIESWMSVQNLWIYLEAVFVGGDIAKQLPKEAKRFQSIDKSWVKIMTRAHETPSVVSCCVGDEMLGQLLPHLLEQLELCQKSLSGYLEKKRLIFPRFFFVSDPALLEILGQASDPHTIQAHLLSVFDNTKSVKFHEKDYEKITAIVSKEEETIELDKPVMAQGNVEIWLGSLLKMAQQSLHTVIRTAAMAINEASNFVFLEFFNTYPAQVGLLGLQLLWTKKSEEALKTAKYDRKIMGSTKQLFSEQLHELIAQTTTNLTRVQRTKFETLITIHVHQHDIFEELHKKNVKYAHDFEWLKQSRFYFKDDVDKCEISITNVDFVYQNEFLGCTERLVITPLTDRCYITLAQALGMSMGAAPAGPAGTGKTETTKDMGKALGKFVVVFNCSDQMDYRGLGKIYKGLAQSGSWGCFDEFNRIDLPVLSVAAQQIAIVLACRKERKRQFIFTDGDVVDLNPEFGLFITMNPGYAGRQELPENLKMLFRTVAMMVPDRQIIIRVKLASCGFAENLSLASKFYTLYKLCEEQLTKQVHYDFGLRNILSVLRTLGQNKRDNASDPESKIVMRVLRDMNLSKLVDEDEPLFLSLISDLFPAITLDTAGYPALEQAIKDQCEEMKLIYHLPWVLKLIQLFETQRVRHGMMALGPSGAGKTECIHVLMKAMSACGSPTKEMRMNPKAITSPQMFGRLDVATNDWTDGIFSTLWRKTLKTKKGENVWLVLDGPVDAIWIENLNSVLDDNKTLTLANGDRIPMAPNCKIVFEPHNIDNASPATVSRNGMVYMSSSALDWHPILEGWLNHRPPTERKVLMELFEGSFTAIYTYVWQSLNPRMETLECNYIRQACDLLEGLIPVKQDPNSGREEIAVLSPEHLGRLYVFAIMWSLGALLELDDREQMQEFMVDRCSVDLPPFQKHPPGTTIFEFLVDDKGNWQHWLERVDKYEYPTDHCPEYSSILVPNVDNVRMNFLVETIHKQNKAVLLIGEQGTAKTVILKSFGTKVVKDAPESKLFKSFNFSSATTPYLFQRTVEAFVDKRMGNTYGPPAGKKMTVFIDDINMPVINEWLDQITNEIVRQLMEMNGFYSLEKIGDFTTITDMFFMAAMIQPGGGRNDIPQRLKRHFSIFNCCLPSNASMDKIFKTIGCGYYCKERGFTDEVVEFVEKVVPLTRKLWQAVKVKMLPTPAKFHYIFNLRDLSRIWEGMLKCIPEVACEPAIILKLWKHESTRVIADRFTNPEDMAWFTKTLQKVVEEDLGEELAQNTVEDDWFVSFLRDAPDVTGEEPDDHDFDAPSIYEPIASFEQLETRLIFFMEQYNESIRGAPIDLVFFKDAMTHLVKISRILQTPRGNALLVGVGGSGKQSLTKLASFIAGYKTFQITLTRSYNSSNLMDDLKILYRATGLQGIPMSFIFTDNDIKDEAFLEYLNNILSSGEVSNLFARDEMDEIQQELIPVMKKELPRHPPTPENLYEYFLSRARNNLHIVLCFSPVGEKFRNRALKFPGLISGCTMDWFARWPKDALIAVAKHFLSSFEMQCVEEVKEQIVYSMGYIHDGVAEACVKYFERFRRSTHVTPKSYLSFIANYKEIYLEKCKQKNDMAQRMNTGLDKLNEASVSVAELSEELVDKEKELAVSSVKAEKVLADVTVQAEAAEVAKQEVQKKKDKAQSIFDSISIDKRTAEDKLEKAKPALIEAENALLTIKPADIATVRKLPKPPHLIMRISDCVLLLLGRPLDQVEIDPDRPCVKPSWSHSLKMLSGGNFLQSLQNFNKDTINDEVVELLQPYFEMPDYTLEVAKKVCGNVAGLCSWTKAMSAYYSINKEVLPLKANLAVQERRLEDANESKMLAQAQLDAKNAELDKVRKLYDDAMREKKDLENDADTCKRRMVAAKTLIDGLRGEKVRWTEQSKEFKAQIERLAGDVLMATGFLSYCGPFNQEYRQLLLRNWQSENKSRSIPYTHNLDLISMLAEKTTISEWNLQGLPSDELSIQNGIICTKATRYPLIIDPQGQGKIWIKNRESTILTVTSLNHKFFRTHLEDCLSQGRPLMIEDIAEELDPILDNVLEKNFIKSGKTLKVKVGDKELDVMEGFRIYITTKLANPAYTPEISARTSIIDFTVTMKGLEDQLLGIVILKEKGELEKERTNLIEDVTANKRKMDELEENLLFKLTSIQGPLVDDESLIEVLNVTKITSEEVKHKLVTAAETEVKINSAREEFRPVATRGSILYFLIVEMSYVNVMYQTSIRQFLALFDDSMEKSDKSPITSKRISNIIDYLTYEVWKYQVRGLYEEHKFLYTLLLTLKICLQSNRIKPNEFMTFIKGGAALDLKAVAPKPKNNWISDMTWLNLVELSKIPQFSEILTQVARNEKQWKQWYDSDAPEEGNIPDGYQNSLDVFKRTLLVRSWCPDRTLAQARKFVVDALGQRFADGVILDFHTMWGESDTKTPLICFLSMGSDPTAQIDTLAKKLKVDCKPVSMGQGQEIHARRLLTQSMSQGGWVLLQNCHLGLNFMDELLQTITEPAGPVHETFRLWITTEGHPQFPINLLQIGLKYTNEPPQGVKAGVKRTYSGVTQDQLDITNMPQWKPMLYTVAILHTVVQERRKFGPLGWNIPYEFNQADLTASIQFLQNHLDDMDPRHGVNWSTVQYMIGEVQYGGRVTDDMDKRLLKTFCKVWFREEMFAPGFQFFTPTGNNSDAGKPYTIPQCKTVQQYLDFIEKLPPVDSPEVFGLHPNANITYQSKTARDILDTILNIQPKESSGGMGETRESTVSRMADDMLSKLPDDYIPHQVKERINEMGALSSMNIFLKQEIDRMQRVITCVRNTLTDLKLAIEGTIIMSEKLREALNNIYDAKVPPSWTRISWDSSTIGFWFTELIERNSQFHAWCFNGRPNVFWMTGFFNPQGFLTAMRQEVTRAHKGWALDQVVLNNEMTKSTKDDITAPPPEGVFVHGLFLDGAGWDRRNSRLIESPPKVLSAPLPVIRIFAENQVMAKDNKMYECPIYKKPRRTDLTFIATVVLRHGTADVEKWIMRGVALLCDIK